jgi:predicted naringenin-chalcone synthase
MSICITNFHHIRPKHELPQTTILDWIAKAHTQAESLKKQWALTSSEKASFHTSIKEKLFQLGAGLEKVQSRGVQMRDCLAQQWEEAEIFQLHNTEQGLGLKERMQFFEQTVDGLFEQFYPNNLSPPDHLIHVTCTGYVSPSGAQKVAALRHWGDKTTVTHAYHMGCYASLPAIRIGSGFIAHSPLPAHVDIVHTELCSLHMDPSHHAVDQLVIQTLFGDGFIKYSLQSKVDSGKPHLKILALHEELIPHSADAMIWRCEDWGFRMGIAKEVPVLIRRSLVAFLEKLLQKAGLNFANLREQLFFAIHPGGPKIIQHIVEQLMLDERQSCHSQMILQNFGNMSSATLPHIWEAMLGDIKVPNQALIVSLAFGPGLTISGALLEKNGER